MSMWEPFTERARRSIVLAQEEAQRLGNNYIGTDITGESARGNGSLGVGESGILDAGPDEVVADNLISGNTGIGLTIDATGASVSGNRIGVDASGLVALPNQGVGIYVESDHAFIGTTFGSSPADINTISENGAGGVEFATAAAAAVSALPAGPRSRAARLVRSACPSLGPSPSPSLPASSASRDARE